MQVGAIIAGVVSALALVASLLFLARQTRESTRQSRLSNQIAGSQAKSEIYGMVDRILYHFLEHPELRPYFYDDVDLPAVSSDPVLSEIRERVLTFAELYADAIERGLDIYQTIDPASDFQSPMESYAGDMWSTSPALRLLIHDHAGWWPSIESWIAAGGLST